LSDASDGLHGRCRHGRRRKWPRWVTRDGAAHARGHHSSRPAFTHAAHHQPCCGACARVDTRWQRARRTCARAAAVFVGGGREGTAALLPRKLSRASPGDRAHPTPRGTAARQGTAPSRATPRQWVQSWCTHAAGAPRRPLTHRSLARRAVLLLATHPLCPVQLTRHPDDELLLRRHHHRLCDDNFCTPAWGLRALARHERVQPGHRHRRRVCARGGAHTLAVHSCRQLANSDVCTPGLRDGKFTPSGPRAA
jgi:hypothetical protein